MKFNKWTLGLAAVGAVSLASAARAEETPMNPVGSALAGVYINGAVDTSIEWAITPHQDEALDNPAFDPAFRFGKQDGFNLNVVELNIGKALDESEWASGFFISLLFGPDAVGYNPSGGPFGGGGGGDDLSIKNAHVLLRTPIGNGIDWKIGVFSTIIGYEVFESWKNPNFSRSWGYHFEPTEHTGILGSYQFSDVVGVNFGVANTAFGGINQRNDENGVESFWCKTVMGSLSLTAPESWGSLAGSTLYVGAVYGFDGGNDDQLNVYLGSVINTPIENLTTGFAFDYVDFNPGSDFEDRLYILGAYASYRATEKLSFHGRAEYGIFDDEFDSSCFWGLTGTLQYDLWDNVLSRLELRYEMDDSFADNKCGLGLFANIVYIF
jgi:hypothetical protein